MAQLLDSLRLAAYKRRVDCSATNNGGLAPEQLEGSRSSKKPRLLMTLNGLLSAESCGNPYQSSSSTTTSSCLGSQLLNNQSNLAITPSSETASLHGPSFVSCHATRADMGLCGTAVSSLRRCDEAPGPAQGTLLTCDPEGRPWSSTFGNNGSTTAASACSSRAPKHQQQQQQPASPDEAGGPSPYPSFMLPFPILSSLECWPVMVELCRTLGFTRPTTLLLALHNWGRIEAAMGKWTPDQATVTVRNTYAAALVWACAKLEEGRMEAPRASQVGEKVGVSGTIIHRVEIVVMKMLEWSPYRDFVDVDGMLVV